MIEIILIIIAAIMFLKISNLQSSIDALRDELLPKKERDLAPKQELSREPISQNQQMVNNSEYFRTKEKPTTAPTSQQIYNQPNTPLFDISDFIKKTFGEKSLEEIIFGNLILKIGISAFVLGVGFFLKYSIDHNWIPIWARILMGLGVGIAMLVFAIKLNSKNDKKIFVEALFGGGIAVLYLSVFAGYALDGFKVLNFSTAFGIMVLITALAGLISIKFNSQSTAIFGLIGGFITPFLINSGSNNMAGLMIYILILNLGVLFISIYKKWTLLQYLAFFFTAIASLLATNSIENFWTISIVYGLIFVLYSIVPYITDIRGQKAKLTLNSTILFVANFIVTLGSYALLLGTNGFDNRYYSVVTIFIAIYLLVYGYIISKKSAIGKDLLFIILTQALGLLLLTPMFLFDNSSLAIFLSIESLVFLYIWQKTDTKHFLLFSIFGFAIAIFVFVFGDIVGYLLLGSYTQDLSTYASSFAITSLFVIGSLVVASRLTRSVAYQEFKASYIFASIAIILLFVVLNIEVSILSAIYNPLAQKLLITILWLIFGILMFAFGFKNEVNNIKKAGTVLIGLAILKAFFYDLDGLDSIYRIILFIVLGVILFALSYIYKNKIDNRVQK